MNSPTPQIPLPGGTWNLGGKTTARVGFGAMQLAERPGREPLPTADAVALLQKAVELGLTHLDTAEFYGHGVSNSLIRQALAPYADDLVIATKVGANRVEGARPALVPAQKPHELRASVDDNLRTLGTERVDVVNLRRTDLQPGIVATGDQVVDLDDQLAELVALRDEGKIGAIGLSTVTVEQVERALPAGIVCVQNAYNLIHRGDEAVLDLCLREGIAWVPYFPLGSAFPGIPKVTGHPEVVAIAGEIGATPTQVGLAWLLQHAPNTLLISGTSSMDHLVENAAVGALHLDEAAMARLDALA